MPIPPAASLCVQEAPKPVPAPVTVSSTMRRLMIETEDEIVQKITGNKEDGVICHAKFIPGQPLISEEEHIAVRELCDRFEKQGFIILYRFEVGYNLSESKSTNDGNSLGFIVSWPVAKIARKIDAFCRIYEESRVWEWSLSYHESPITENLFNDIFYHLTDFSGIHVNTKHNCAFQAIGALFPSYAAKRGMYTYVVTIPKFATQQILPGIYKHNVENKQ